MLIHTFAASSKAYREVAKFRGAGLYCLRAHCQRMVWSLGPEGKGLLVAMLVGKSNFGSGSPEKRRTPRSIAPPSAPAPSTVFTVRKIVQR